MTQPLRTPRTSIPAAAQYRGLVSGGVLPNGREIVSVRWGDEVERVIREARER